MVGLQVLCFETGGLSLAHVCDSRLTRLNEICKDKISSGYATKLGFSPFLCIWTWFLASCSFTDLFLPSFWVDRNILFRKSAILSPWRNGCSLKLLHKHYLSCSLPKSATLCCAGFFRYMFEGMDLVYCLANCNRGCCSPGWVYLL